MQEESETGTDWSDCYGGMEGRKREDEEGGGQVKMGGQKNEWKFVTDNCYAFINSIFSMLNK